jgi:hypothetical protein
VAVQFMQIIEITTDRVGELVRLEDEWRAAGLGRRTGIADWICADRGNPGRYFSVNLFPSLDQAMANGALPETNALAEQAMQLGDAAFYDCDVLHDIWSDELDGQATRLAQMFANAEVPERLFTDDVIVELNVPHPRQEFRGLDALRASVPATITKGTIEEQRVVPSIGGFVLEIALRTHAYSRQVCVARTAGGLIAHLSVYCTGDFS